MAKKWRDLVRETMTPTQRMRAKGLAAELRAADDAIDDPLDAEFRELERQVAIRDGTGGITIHHCVASPSDFVRSAEAAMCAVHGHFRIRIPADWSAPYRCFRCGAMVVVDA